MAELTNDRERCIVLKENLRIFAQVVMTTEIECLEGKDFGDFSEDDREKLRSIVIHDAKKNISLSGYNDEYKCEVLDCGFAVDLFEKYYFNEKEFWGKFKSNFSNKHLEDSNYDSNTFRNKMGNYRLELLEGANDIRGIRNDTAHDFNANPKAGELYILLKSILKLIKSAKGKLEYLNSIEYSAFYEQKIKTFDELTAKAVEFEKSCYAPKTSNSASFKFKTTEYVVNPDGDNDFDILIIKMLENWEDGKKSLKYDYNELLEVVEEHYSSDRTEVVNFKQAYDYYSKSEPDTMENDLLYVRVMNKLLPSINGIYWKGERYSESYFAAFVLQTLTRHLNRNTIEDKKNTLSYRIQKFEEWGSPDHTDRQGIQISILEMCKLHVLSEYYKNKNDDKGFNYAKKFEEAIINGVNIKSDEEYDGIVNAVLTLIAYMRKRVTYILPIKIAGEVTAFETMNEFKDYIKAYMPRHSVDDLAKLIQIIRDDNNFKFFKNNNSLYAQEG